jgi:cholesterol oxidase
MTFRAHGSFASGDSDPSSTSIKTAAEEALITKTVQPLAPRPNRVVFITAKDCNACDRERVLRSWHILSATDLISIAHGMADLLCRRAIDHASGRRWRARAPRLVLAAGTLNTVRLLLDARDRLGTLPRLPRALGARFTTNGDLLSFVRGPRRSPRADLGPTISALHRQRSGARQRYVIGEAGLPLNALPLPGWLHARLARSAALFAIGRERAAGALWLEGSALRSSSGRAADPELYDELERTSARIARGYAARGTLLAWPGGAGADPLVTVHPLGGAAIGRGPDEGVVAHAGPGFGHPGLYVAAAALYPHAPGIPPSMTIAALAERIAALMR